MIRILTLSFLFLFSIHLHAQQTEAYRIVNQKGEPITFDNLAEAALQHQVTFFGELHNNTMAHWLQLRLAKAMLASGKMLIMGAEMFETDQQLVLDEYLAELITDKQFEDGTRLWNNYKTDYKALVLLAQKNNLQFVATNVPRRYASMVAANGSGVLDSLSESAKLLISTLPLQVPYEMPSYRKMKDMMGPHAGDKADNFVAAQALKDATMAHSIFKHIPYSDHFLHFNGSFHSDFHEGIIHYLKEMDNSLSIMVISTIEKDNLNDLTEEELKKGDYLIVVPEDFPKSY